jgi:hypothetical protein
MESIWVAREEFMSSFTIKDIPEELLEALRELAERDRRSMTQEAIVLLSEVIERRFEDDDVRSEADRQADAWEKLTGQWRSDESADEEISNIYESRTAGREVDL